MYERIEDHMLSIATEEDLKLLKITPEKTADREPKVEDLTHMGSGPAEDD
jgi:hypothetical protein